MLGMGYCHLCLVFILSTIIIRVDTADGRVPETRCEDRLDGDIHCGWCMVYSIIHLDDGTRGIRCLDCSTGIPSPHWIDLHPDGNDHRVHLGSLCESGMSAKVKVLLLAGGILTGVAMGWLLYWGNAIYWNRIERMVNPPLNPSESTGVVSSAVSAGNKDNKGILDNKIIERREEGRKKSKLNRIDIGISPPNRNVGYADRSSGVKRSLQGILKPRSQFNVQDEGQAEWIIHPSTTDRMVGERILDSPCENNIRPCWQKT